MRVIVLGCLAACALIASPIGAAEPEDEPKTADEAALMWMQAVGDRWPDRWQGRQHYLFDEDNPPETTATGRTNDAQACADEPVRVPRADGSTAIKRMNRCR
jgi:hypothetical protein